MFSLINRWKLTDIIMTNIFFTGKSVIRQITYSNSENLTHLDLESKSKSSLALQLKWLSRIPQLFMFQFIKYMNISFATVYYIWMRWGNYMPCNINYRTCLKHKNLSITCRISNYIGAILEARLMCVMSNLCLVKTHIMFILQIFIELEQDS